MGNFMGIAETIEIFMKELAHCTKEQADFIEEILSWDDETKMAFKLAKKIFEEDTDD